MSTPSIDDFRFNYTAIIYEVKRKISKAFIKSLFSKISENKVGSYTINRVKQAVQKGQLEYKWSCVAFKHEKKPTFLEDTILRDEIHCCLLLIEVGRHLLLFKDKVFNYDKLLEKHLKKLDYSEVCSLFSNKESHYESITLNSLNISRIAIKSKKIEARNLIDSMPMLGTNRQIPKNVKRRDEAGFLSLTPVSSRVSNSTKKGTLEEIGDWALLIAAELEAERGLDNFLTNFAKPVSFEEIKDSLTPTGIYFQLDDLENNIIENKSVCWLNHKTKKDIAMSNARQQRLFNAAKETFLIKKESEKSNVIDANGNVLCNIKINQKSITVSGGIAKNIRIKDGLLTESLSQIINRNNYFHVAFDNPEILYSMGALFKDAKILNDIEGFLNSYLPYPALASITSEKGTSLLTTEDTKFHSTSLFDFVESELSKDDYLICDDLGDEWADHLGLTLGEGTPPSISFYISKHKIGTSTSASQFHDVVGQAIKNIGHVYASSDLFERKIEMAKGEFAKYGGVLTKISKVRKGEAGDIIEAYKKITSYPNTIRQVFLVVDFISKKELRDVLVKLRTNQTSHPHYIQLFWILTSFMSVCQEMAIRPVVVCQP